MCGVVCRIFPGTTFRGVLNYNENKVATGEARLLSASGYPIDHHRLNFLDKLERLESQAKLNTGAKKKVLHITVSFSPKDLLDDEKMVAIAEDYMERIGFGNQPYLVYRHTDTHHPHLHIVTTKIDQNGVRMPTFRIGKYKSNPAREAIENKYGLVCTGREQPRKESMLLLPADLEKAVYGQKPTKETITKIVRSVVENFNFSSLHELNAALRQFNVLADRGAEDSQMFRNKGLVYSIINAKGEKLGKPIKASSIYTEPTLENLEEKFKKNKKKEQYKERLRRIIDDVMGTGITTRQDFEHSLADKGVYVLFRENEDKRVYGITYVDNKSLCVFNGSDLDSKKTYSAKGILQL